MARGGILIEYGGLSPEPTPFPLFAVLAKTLVRDLLPDLKAPGGNVVEKIEGLARLANGDWIVVNDNDGVDDGANSGETQLIRLGQLSGG